MMDMNENKLRHALLVVLRPLIKILLRCGIGFRDFAEIAKYAYVEISTAEYGIRGRPTNISRVAVMTGLTRKEVRRVRDVIESDVRVPEISVTPLAKVLHHWFKDPRFGDENGEPVTLPFENGDPSFVDLCRENGGDIPPGALRTELIRVGAIEEDDSGCLTPVSRIARPSEFDDRVVTYLAHLAYPTMLSISHNMEREPEVDTWPSFTTYTSGIGNSDLNRVSDICRDLMKDSATSVDDLFSAYESLRDTGEGNATVGVCTFMFEDAERQSSVWSPQSDNSK